MDMQTAETIVTPASDIAPKPEKVTPPAPRKGGKRPGAGRKKKVAAGLFGKTKKSPVSEAARIEAIAEPEAASAAKVKPDDAAPSKRKTRAISASPEKFGRSLQGIHKGYAVLTKQPWWELETSEAAELAKDLFDVFAEFGMEISERAMVLSNCAGSMMMIYGPRLAMGHAQRRAKAKAAAPPKAKDAPFEQAPPVAVEPIIPDDFFGSGGGGG